MQIMAFLPMAVEAVAETNRGRGLALARRRRVDRGDQDQLAIGLVFLPGDEVSRNLGLVMAVGNQIFLLDAELGADLHDRFLVRRRDIARFRCSLRGSTACGRPKPQNETRNAPTRKQGLASKTKILKTQCRLKNARHEQCITPAIRTIPGPAPSPTRRAGTDPAAASVPPGTGREALPVAFFITRAGADHPLIKVEISRRHKT
jgi:hypothetical protein